MRELGHAIGRYGLSRSIVGVLWFMAAMFVIAGLGVLSLIPQIGRGLNFSGDVSILYASGFGAIALAPLFPLLSGVLYGPPTVYELFENALQVTVRKNTQVYFLEDIQDVYASLQRGIIFRTADAPWVHILGSVSKIAELRGSFLELHAALRGTKLLADIRAGGVAEFRCFKEREVLLNTPIDLFRKVEPSQIVTLSATTLTFGETQLDIKTLADADVNLWLDRLNILDLNGQTVFSMSSKAFFSRYVLAWLLRALQNA